MFGLAYPQTYPHVERAVDNAIPSGLGYNRTMESLLNLGQVKYSTGTLNLSNQIGNLITALAFVASLAAVVYIVWSGIKMIMAGSNPKLFADAKNHLINAVIGIGIVFSCYFLINLALGLGSTASRLKSAALIFNQSGGNQPPVTNQIPTCECGDVYDTSLKICVINQAQNSCCLNGQSYTSTDTGDGFTAQGECSLTAGSCYGDYQCTVPVEATPVP